MCPKSDRLAPDWEGEKVPEIRTCGCCGHFDNCQMMCNLDFEDASEDMECRHWLEADSDE
jgi:hypothetical protein